MLKTLIVIVSSSVSAPPLPVLPWSSVWICTLAAPIKLVVGEKMSPFKAVLIADSAPVKTITGSAVPLPVVKVNPVTPLRVAVPLVEVRVTRTLLPPASTSAILIRLGRAVLKVRSTFWLVVCVARERDLILGPVSV